METMQDERLAVGVTADGKTSSRASDSVLPGTVKSGVVKWFNPGKGYGFIAPDNGGDDIFVHISAVQHAGLRKLNEGERVRFALEQREGRVAAVGIEKQN